MGAEETTGRLGLLAEQQGPDIQLDLGALLISATFSPDLDIDYQLSLFDSLAAGARSRIAETADPLTCINYLNEYLFDHVGFAGNELDYYDPGNSFIHEVLSSRQGIPITLSLVYIEVGRRLGVPLVGIGMPGHFLVRHRDEEALFIDPYYRGLMLSESECAKRFRSINRTVRWDRSFLLPVDNRSLLSRILRNLSAIWVKRNNPNSAIKALGLLIALQPQEMGHRRDRGLLYFQSGLRHRALHDLEQYLDLASPAPDAWYVQRIVTQIKDGR